MLKYKIADLSQVDEKYKDLYIEKDGAFILDTDNVYQEDYEKTYATLQKVRDEKKELEKQVKSLTNTVNAFGDLTPESLSSMKSELAELKSKDDDVTKLKSINADYKYQLEQLQNSNQKVMEQLQTYEKERKGNILKETARKALKENGVSDYAIDDALLWANNQLKLTEDGTVVVKDGVYNMSEGLNVNGWARLLREQKPHLFGGSVGGNASGSSSVSSSEDWSNTGIGGGINVTRLAKALKDDKQGTIAILKQKGLYEKAVTTFPFLLKK